MENTLSFSVEELPYALADICNLSDIEHNP
jgi:hypothetical protein